VLWFGGQAGAHGTKCVSVHLPRCAWAERLHKIYTRFEIAKRVASLVQQPEIFPGTVQLVVLKHSPNQLVLMKWGLVPPWAMDARVGNRAINARAETIAEKPFFRKAL
jgi:putative SOS response-associated peptidase YedK